MLPN